MDKLNRELDGLLAAYREACPAPEPSASFMPRIWERIEARRNFSLRFRRLTQVFVAGSAVLCLLIAGLTVLPGNRTNPELGGSYIEALAQAQPPDTLAGLGIPRPDSLE